ncbi:hypothetical protein FA13DRAFT_1719021 [Coprinellus micaceus]|uniref:Uncharacterized protein n=1 Tax=Coprinellus micaceus TaxID=71717 RepID=A0A4Y7SC77_COPMI|nr:hypothetical protein FA13DRAFT_1719021 [Coprinellus micaceus]
MNATRGSQKQSPLPSVILAHFLRQIQAHQCRTPTRGPIPLHYDSRTESLKEFPWPFDLETGQRVPPSMLESYRRTHMFQAPSCLCAFLDKVDYTESVIGIIEVATGGNADENHDSILNGQYVAVCERRRCGYSLCLEKFYMLSGLKMQGCLKRETPLSLREMSYVSDLRGPAYSQSKAGLLQMIGEPSIRGGRFRFPYVKPDVSKKEKDALLRSLTEGMGEDLFYGTFVQCFICKDIMLRPGMFGPHRCSSQKRKNRHPTPCFSTSGFHGPGYRALRRGEAPLLGRIPGDVPEAQPLASLSVRSSSPIPTDVDSDGEGEPSGSQGSVETDSDGEFQDDSDAVAM